MPVTVRGNDILFNDSSTQSTAAVVNTTSVLTAYSGTTAGLVGAVAHRTQNFTTWTANSTIAGSFIYSGAPGTWRALQPGVVTGTVSCFCTGTYNIFGGTYVRIS